MPGRRNLARERAAHARVAPARCAAFHTLLRTQLPEHDRVLIGRPAILAFLDRLGCRRRNGRPLSWRIVSRWRREEDFPLLRGRTVLGNHRAPPVSTAYAVTAWTLSRFSASDARLFRVIGHAPSVTDGNAPEQSEAQAAA